MSNLLKRLLVRSLAVFQLELRRKRKQQKVQGTMQGALERVKALNFSPRTVIDVGSAFGTAVLYEAFPEARHFLLEPLEEFEPCLSALSRDNKNIEYLIAAAAERSGEISLNVHPDLVGSSIYSEDEKTNVNGYSRIVTAVALDELREQYALEGPILLKVDVQGAELDVLRGAHTTLEIIEYIILETSLYRFFVDGPQLHDVIKFMKDYGFVVYDIAGLTYRPLDGALAQVDLCFVKEAGEFRGQHIFASKAQRKHLTERLRASVSSKLKA